MSAGAIAPGDPTASLAHAWGAPPVRGLLRSAPEDFQVTERLGFTPSGAGAHAYLQIEKRGANTAWVARRIAELAGVKPGEVGYAGLKDRHALTRQWFSAAVATEPDWQALEDAEIRLLAVTRHPRKLRRGELAGNAFTLRVRGLTGDLSTLPERLERLSAQGVPNYFGPQRFGHEGGNLERAEALFAGRLTVRDRQERGLYLSAARSFLFNQVLSRRVAEGSWRTPLPGEVIELTGGTGLLTLAEPTDAVRARVERGELQLTGPLWGRGALPSAGTVAALEQAETAPWSGLRAGLEGAGLEQERRALQLRPEALHGHLEGEDLLLSFSLPPGAFATSVLRELVAVTDVRGDAHLVTETGL